MNRTKNLRKLIGKRGLTLSILRPSGFVLIEGESYDCQGTRPWIIEEGASVIVTGVLMDRFLQVREIGVQ